jgi:hypothetical protein
MALIVETGVGLANAESYLSVEDANAYHAARGNAAWTAEGDNNPEAALRRATAYLDGRYRNRWRGWRTHGRAQALEWPRQYVYAYGPNDDDIYGYARDFAYGAPYSDTAIASNEIPRELKDAVAEAALREIIEPGILTPDITLTGRVKSETVGPISTTYADVPYGSAASRPIITMIDDLLANLLRPSGSTVALVRA